MGFWLVETDLAAIGWLIQEADTSRAFLPSKDEPGFAAYGLLEEFKGRPGYHLFALTDGTNTAGFVSTLPSEKPDTLDIGPMYIRPQSRGQGLGKALVQELIAWTRSNDTGYLYTRTWGGNLPSRRIFEGLGFQLVKEKPGARTDNDSTLYYILDLNKPPGPA